MPEFNKWTVKSLKEYCKENNIKIPNGSKKADIVNLIENTSNTSEAEQGYKLLTEQREDIIKKALKVCKKDGVKKILDYFKLRAENNRLKNVFTIHSLNLENPTVKEKRICLKYYQEIHNYSEDEKLLINQMITQPKYIDPNYVDPRRDEFKQIEIESYTYDVPISKTSKQRSLNKAKRL